MAASLERLQNSICRIVDKDGDPRVGACVFVSDTGGDYGLALTVWHNFDFDMRLGKFNEDKVIPTAWMLPRWGSVESLLNENVIVVGRWSNPIQDFAVLKVQRHIIHDFDLVPAALSIDVVPGMHLIGVGFQRPNELKCLDHVALKMTESPVPIKKLQNGQRVFEMDSLDPAKRVPWDSGMSGGAVFSADDGALVGIPALVKPNETGSQMYRGYAVPLSVVAETWTSMYDHCRRETRRAGSSARETISIPHKEWIAERSPPGAMLRADYEIVPFHGRHAELSDLKAWCDDANRVGIRLYTGRGGMGKTRLFIEMCKQLQCEEWRAGFLVNESGVNSGSCENVMLESMPVFVVVDYAETRRTETKSVLNGVFRSSSNSRIRVVLIARSAGEWWDHLRSEGNGVGELLASEATSLRSLNAVADSIEDRGKSFLMAATAFAHKLAKTPPVNIPLNLEANHFESVMLLHASALASTEGVAVDVGEQAILDYILRRERRYWSEMAAVKQLGRTLNQGIGQAIAAITAIGGVSDEASALSILRKVPLLHDQPGDKLHAVAHILHECYPGSKWVEPVTPDLLAEHLLQEELAENTDLLSVLLD